MKQQMLEEELKVVHEALYRLVEKTRLLMDGSSHLDPEDMQRTFRFAEAVVRKRSVENLIEMAESDTRRLLAQYGGSTRPAWVGEEIGINQYQVKMYRQELAELEEELKS